MADLSRPVLVYDRIDVNRRNTRLLLAAFATLLLPFAYGLAQILTAFLLYTPAVFIPGRHPDPDVTGTEIVSLRMVLLAFISAVGFAYVGNALISSFLLWRADARRACRDREPDLFRTVENLCIGAGLPPPTLYIVESTEPNAFTTGCDPEHASLAISRGLLQLLDERELAAVVAHELSHIGNHDTDVSTMLAALVATVRLPLRVLTGIAWLISFCVEFDSRHSIDPAAKRNARHSATAPGEEWCRSTSRQITSAAVIALAGLAVSLLMMGFTKYDGLEWLLAQHGDLAGVLGVEWNLRTIVAVAAPIYVLILAPGCATLLRRTMSRQRDFLADADAALLTRDPEGVALALAKVGGAIHVTPNADAATAHLYFVDPLPHASWWDAYNGAYPSHPPIDARIALLARMGDGMPEAELRDAAAAGTEFRQRPPLVEAAPQPDTPFRLPGTQFRLTGPAGQPPGRPLTIDGKYSNRDETDYLQRNLLRPQ